MLLGKQIQILVFTLDDNGTFDNIGEKIQLTLRKEIFFGVAEIMQR